MKRPHSLALSLFVSMQVSATAPLADPTSEAADQEEERFIASIEKRLLQKRTTASAPKTQSVPARAQTVSDMKNSGASSCIKTSSGGQASELTPSSLPGGSASSVVKNSQQEAVSHVETKTFRQKAPFTGFFCGLSGSMNHVYSKSELYSLGWQQLGERINRSGEGWGPNAFFNIHNGSFAYNNNTWLFQGQAFIGYDFALHPWIRVGIEFQGGIGWRSYEVASCGVFACKDETLEDQTLNLSSSFVSDTVKKGLTELVIPGDSEINYAYIRPTIQAPYSWSLLPRFGVPLSSSTLLYAKVGVKFENMTVTDHPETIDIQVQYYPKQTADRVYDKTKATWIGGLGLEANVSRKMFLRLEYYCYGGPHINLTSQDLKESKENSATSDNRQLDYLDVKNMKNFQLGLGAGLRF